MGNLFRYKFALTDESITNTGKSICIVQVDVLIPARSSHTRAVSNTDQKLIFQPVSDFEIGSQAT